MTLSVITFALISGSRTADALIGPPVIEVSELSLQNLAGEKVESVTVGVQSVVKVSIENIMETKQEFLILVEIRDGNGVSGYLSWQSSAIE